MGLFKHLIDNIAFSSCSSLEVVALFVHQEIEQSGVPFESAFVDVRRELGNWSIDKVRESFRHLEDASRLTTAVSDIVEFETKIVPQYPWDVTDVIVGLIMTQATPELCEYLRSLPTWANYKAKDS